MLLGCEVLGQQLWHAFSLLPPPPPVMCALQLARGTEQESLLNFDGAERAAGTRQVTIPLPDQRTEPDWPRVLDWPRVFHCDLNEEVELPLLAEPRPGAEQV